LKKQSSGNEAANKKLKIMGSKDPEVGKKGKPMWDESGSIDLKENAVGLQAQNLYLLNYLNKLEFLL
jgi:hypothetical protein